MTTYQADRLCMNRAFLRTNSTSLLAFAAKHDYFDLIIELALVMIDTPVREVVNVLPPHIFRTWVRR